MKRLLREHLSELGLIEKIEVEFIHTPTYSPDFNLAEYEIHQLRLQKLHHLPADVTIVDIEKKLEGIQFLMDSSQISNTLEHIFSLANRSKA